MMSVVDTVKLVEDARYKFRAEFPGVPGGKSGSYLSEESDPKSGSLAWRNYSSGSPSDEKTGAYTAAIKAFETQTTDTAVLFNAGESDASQTLGVPLVSRKDGTFGPSKLPSVTLQFQGGAAGTAPAVTGKVLLVVKEHRLYEVAFFFSGPDRSAIGEKFFQSFAILP